MLNRIRSAKSEVTPVRRGALEVCVIPTLKGAGLLNTIPDPYIHNSTCTTIMAFCRICHSEESDDDNKLVMPCKCDGTLKHVHLNCLNSWRVLSGLDRLKCEVCKSEYTTPLPSRTIFQRLEDTQKHLTGVREIFTILNQSKCVHEGGSQYITISSGHMGVNSASLKSDVVCWITCLLLCRPVNLVYIGTLPASRGLCIKIEDYLDSIVSMFPDFAYVVSMTHPAYIHVVKRATGYTYSSILCLRPLDASPAYFDDSTCVIIDKADRVSADESVRIFTSVLATRQIPSFIILTSTETINNPHHWVAKLRGHYPETLYREYLIQPLVLDTQQ